jgi:hypothetical protein
MAQPTATVTQSSQINQALRRVSSIRMQICGDTEDDSVNYDEVRVPPYNLPQVLCCSDGTLVETAATWELQRKPEIMALFGNLLYGIVPPRPARLNVAHTVLGSEELILPGTAVVRKTISIVIAVPGRGEQEMRLLLFAPSGNPGPLPAFLHLSFHPTRGEGVFGFDASSSRPGKLKNGLPLADILRRGYALVVLCHTDLCSHNEVGFQDTIHHLFYPPGQEFPKGLSFPPPFLWRAPYPPPLCPSTLDITLKYCRSVRVGGGG